MIDNKKLPPHIAYRFEYDHISRKYRGITYDMSLTYKTDVVPHFEAGFVTIFNPEKNEWYLVEDKDFYSKFGGDFTQLEGLNYKLQTILTKVNDLEKLVFNVKNEQMSLSTMTFNFTHLENLNNDVEIKNTDRHREIRRFITDLMQDVYRYKKVQENSSTAIFDTLVRLIEDINTPFYTKAYKWLKKKLKK